MTFLVRSINTITRLVLGVGIIDLWQKADRSKKAAHQAEQYAQQKQFMTALLMAESIFEQWYPSQSVFERLFRFSVMGDTLNALKNRMKTWELLTEQEYDAALERSHWLATEGRFQEAIALLEPVNAKFFQPQGKALLNQLSQIMAGRNPFNLGLFAEKSGDFVVAIEHYQNAAILSPEWQNESRMRLAIIAIKTHDWTKALSYLDSFKSEQAVYLREFIYAKLGNWQQTEQEWPFIYHFDLQSQESELKRLKKEIQDCVAQDDLEKAKASSQKLLEQLHDDPLVRENLAQHIQPRLEIMAWNSLNWSSLAKIAEQQWLDHWNITTLHNWALATYHQVSLDPSYLRDLIVAWSTALANLHHDPTLQQIPWLKNASLDIEDVFTALKHRLEILVNEWKETASETDVETNYDLYRLETKALELMGSPPQRGLRVKGLFITPGCYQRYYHQLRIPPLSPKLWGTLYTQWGYAILACLDGDIVKAMQMKPLHQPNSEVEQYAEKFVSYHEGCYYLQLSPGSYPRWNLAIAPLKQAQTMIRNSPEWSAQIDQLAEKHYKAIFWNVSDRREFARFWNDLLSSPLAQSYLED